MSKDHNSSFVMGEAQQNNAGNLVSGTRLSTTQRIISPAASSVNHYPHLKGEGTQIISAAGS